MGCFTLATLWHTVQFIEVLCAGTLGGAAAGRLWDVCFAMTSALLWQTPQLLPNAPPT